MAPEPSAMAADRAFALMAGAPELHGIGHQRSRLHLRMQEGVAEAFGGPLQQHRLYRLPQARRPRQLRSGRPPQCLLSLQHMAPSLVPAPMSAGPPLHRTRRTPPHTARITENIT